jgi:hypothetical protein
MAKTQDPNTEARREAFRKYCESKGWKNPDGTWAVVDIGKHFDRKSNQINNILYGHGSFGPTVANALANYAGLGDGYFEPGGVSGNLSQVAYDLAKTFDQFGFDEDDGTESAAYNAAVAALVKFLPKRAAN